MSLIATIDAELQKRRDIVRVAVTNRGWSPRLFSRKEPLSKSDIFSFIDRNWYTCHETEYHVAPRAGIYDPVLLQQFMLGIVPQLKPRQVREFEDISFHEIGDFMELGSVTYREKLAEEYQTITNRLVVNDPEAFPDIKTENGVAVISGSHQSEFFAEATIYVYPTYGVGKDALKGKLEQDGIKGYVSRALLELYRMQNETRKRLRNAKLLTA